MKQICALLSVAVILFTFAGCQKQIFGVDEATWNTLHEPERAKIIEDYNKKEEQRIANEQKIREKQLDIEAKSAPFYVAADVLSSIRGTPKQKSHRKEFRGTTKIQSFSSTYRAQEISVGGASFEISPFSRASEAWIQGQKVTISSSEQEPLFPVKIKNLDNGETIFARKKM